MLTYKQFKKLKFAGTKDALSLVGIGAGFVLTNPYFDFGIYGALAGFCVATVGGGSIGFRLFQRYRRESYFESALKVNSDDPVHEWIKDKPLDGFLLGYCVDTGKPVTISYDDAMRHFLILGQSGVGKTVLGRFMMLQQILAGGGLMFVDGKMNGDDIKLVHDMCRWAGRPHDFIVINPGVPEQSNTYNPILYGDPDEVASRMLSLIPSTESNAGADYYKQSGNQGVTTIVAALQRAKLAYNFIDLSILLMNQKALQYLENVVPASAEKTNLSLFLDQYRVAGKEGKMMLDMKRLKETFGGIGGRMFTFGTGNFGKVTNTYTPDVNLFEAIIGNKIIYMPLPTMGKDVAASNFGKMEIGDLRTAISWVQSLPEENRPWPPLLGFFDEAGSYVNATWSRMFEQARSARFCLCPAIQTSANFEAISSELASMVTGNTLTKIFFQIGEQKTADMIADLIGKEIRIKNSLSKSGSYSESSQSSKVTPGGNQSSGDNIGFSESESEEYRVTADELKRLGKGEAIVFFDGKRVHHIKIPFASLDSKVKEKFPELILNKYRKNGRKGIKLFQQAQKYLSTNANKPKEEEVEND